MSLVKIPFIILDAINMRVNATPPNPPIPLCESIIPDWRERFLRSLALPSRLLRAMYWTTCLIEILVIIASQFPSNVVSKHILTTLILNRTSPLRIRVTPLFILGNIIGICGTTLRVQSFRTLGCLFTFELCIRKNHRLVVNGPYAFIRHPSYTGLIMTIIGYYCNHASGSWLRECGLLETILGKLMLCVWMTIAGAVVASLLLRVSREDQILQMKFGEEWERWARRVPYKLVPGIY
ncbi:hypothetical protein D9615_006828 [Tricholomella constricta]|uniref:Protein-S-isoprenylcysteine O-methyltransferase n=1 Tax=Tricholomella constricta TaxID=117010 RepID=A0A8H5H7M5_9AGAR|nr:hypothetical protein D9615_006828 [Tricholomella constricta]